MNIDINHAQEVLTAMGYKCHEIAAACEEIARLKAHNEALKKEVKQLQVALAEADRTAEFNFEQWQDCGKELAKACEEIEQLTLAIADHITVRGEYAYKLAAAQATISKLREALGIYAEQYNSYWVNGMPILDPLCDEALVLPNDTTALDAILEPYKRDAERYRWLREQHWTNGTLTVAKPEDVMLGRMTYSDKYLDETIDQVMEGNENE